MNNLRQSLTSPCAQPPSSQGTAWVRPYRPIRADELHALLNAARKTDVLAHSKRTKSQSTVVTSSTSERVKAHHWEAFIILMVYCGLRQRELLQLRWERVSLDARTITFDGYMYRQPREIRIADEAHAVLLRMPKNSERLFELETRNLNARWQRLCQRADLHGLPMSALRCSRIIEG